MRQLCEGMNREPWPGAPPRHDARLSRFPPESAGGRPALERKRLQTAARRARFRRSQAAARSTKRAAHGLVNPRPELEGVACPGWGPGCTRVRQAALHAAGPAAPNDGGGTSPREDADLQRVLECLGPGADELLAAASLATARSARRGWAAVSRLRLPSADWLVDEAIHTYLAHEVRHRCEELGQAGLIECDAQVNPSR